MSQNTQHRKPRKPKKFRFSLLHQWLVNNFEPCKVADVGGGKGTLAYLLQESGWEVTTIDPAYQELPHKYKTFEVKPVIPDSDPRSRNAGHSAKAVPILQKKKLKIEDRTAVGRITDVFSEEMAKDFDLIIGMHVHGANMQIIKACAEYGKDYILFPCCVIDEPIEKEHGINWRESLVEYAESLGHSVKKVQLNFKGKNIGIYTDKHLKKKENPDPEINKQVLILDSELNDEFLE